MAGKFSEVVHASAQLALAMGVTEERMVAEAKQEFDEFFVEDLGIEFNGLIGRQVKAGFHRWIERKIRKYMQERQ